MSQQPKLGDILLRAGVIDQFQLRSALGEQQRWGGRLGVTMIKLGFVEEKELVRGLASQLGLPVAHLEGKRIERDVLALISVEVAERSMCLPLFVKEDAGKRTLYLGMEDPCDLSVLDDLRFRTGMQVKPVLMGPSELCEGIDRFYHRPEPETEVELTRPEPVALPLEPEPESEFRIEPGRGPGPAETSVDATRSFGDESLELDDVPVTETLLDDPESPAPAEEPSQPSTRDLLRLVTQLLLEKGLLDREELTDRVKALQRG